LEEGIGMESMEDPAVTIARLRAELGECHRGQETLAEQLMGKHLRAERQRRWARAWSRSARYWRRRAKEERELTVELYRRWREVVSGE
jgi:hypothetical protein